MPIPVVLVYSLLDYVVAVAVRALPLSLRALGWRRLSITTFEYDTCMCIPDTNDTDTLGRAALPRSLPHPTFTSPPVVITLPSTRFYDRCPAQYNILCDAVPHAPCFVTIPTDTTGTWLIHTFRSHGHERKAWATPRPLHVWHVSSVVHREAQVWCPMPPGHARCALSKIQRDLYSKYQGAVVLRDAVQPSKLAPSFPPQVAYGLPCTTAGFREIDVIARAEVAKQSGPGVLGRRAARPALRKQVHAEMPLQSWDTIVHTYSVQKGASPPIIRTTKRV